MKTIEYLDASHRAWFEASIAWSDGYWSSDAQLLLAPNDRETRSKLGTRPVPHIIRDSVWYAAGLLLRRQETDVARALSTLEAVLHYQFDEPGVVYHGTFYRYVGEPHPPAQNAVIWQDYDPNWREFIGSVFIILLREFDTLIPPALQERMRRAILLAAEGAFARKVAAEYTNISLMSAFLLDYAGIAFANETWRAYALSQAEEIHRLFSRFKTFNEYNSPTYYGVDFYALALWREYGSTPLYREHGASMEAELWRDLAQFYHAGMRNMCGPYDRSYGMDMTAYLALLGLWIGAVTLPGSAPLPDPSQPFEHAADFFFMPLVALVGSRPPQDVLPHLSQFQGERLLERTIEPQRTATAWLSSSLMLGAEADHLNSWRTNQFHPATAHWLTPDGAVGWMRIRSESLIQGVAQPRQIRLYSHSPAAYVIDLYAPQAAAEQLHAEQWRLPGVTIHLAGGETSFAVSPAGELLRVQMELREPLTFIFET